MNPTFFATPDEWRNWLAKHHAQAKELLVGFRKKGSGQPSMTWGESVDVALCFGWIDGVRRRIDAENYSIRFTPRKLHSVWSAVNIRRVADLTSKGLMQPAGLTAFESRKENRSAIYSFEQSHVALRAKQEQQFRSNSPAWKFFKTKPPWYQKAAMWWVISAKREQTQSKRLAALIDSSAQGETLAHLTRKVTKQA